jgi:anti-sigma factor RsiW
MDCHDTPNLLDAYIDGELDPQRTAQLEAHILGCARCEASVGERRQLQSTLSGAAEYRAAPDSLRASVMREMERPPSAARRTRAPFWAWIPVAATIALSASTIWLAVHRSTAAAAEEIALRDAVSSHIRSLMASHLADIAISDQHAVKPWFAGKLDFSPPVIDHAAEGFPLAGGRLDYLEGRPVAAVVYNRRAHIINLFICPDPSATPSQPRTSEDRGYHEISWSDGAMRFWAVSDLNADELATFAKLIRNER